MIRCVLILLAACWAYAAVAQQPTQLSPLAAYEQATRPIEVVHRSVANWSESEAASLAVAIKNGTEACAARKPEDYAGDQLIAYARLCALGVQWPAVEVAAEQYVESKDPAKPQLSLAYGMKLEAELQLHKLPQVIATAKTMLTTLPYDALVDTTVNEALDYVQLAYTPLSLDLHGVRQPVLLTLLAQAKVPVPRETIYADGLAYAAEQQYLGKAEEAAATVAELDEALAKGPVTADETLLIAARRAQYAMLGQPLPKMDLRVSLDTLKPKPVIDPEQSAAMALLVFPPWCAQCVRMSAADLTTAATTLKRGAVQVFVLLAATPADVQGLGAPKAPVPPGKAAPPPTPAELLLHTPSIVVPAETLELLHATDFPWVVVTDHAGIVRFIGVAPENALKTGMYVDRATDHVAEHWPSRFVPAPPVSASVVK